MARKKRVWYPGATYHLMSRGNRRAAIFQEHSDYLYFLECVQKVKEKYPFKVVDSADQTLDSLRKKYKCEIGKFFANKEKVIVKYNRRDII